MAEKTKIVSFLFIFLFIVIGCANQQAPDGGEIDKTPPKVVEVFPNNSTINFEDNYFEITFSEWVDKRSVQDAIFVSPFIEKGFEFDWSGRTLTVYFKEELQENTTYTITVGAEVQDLNNRNKMTEPFTFAFSTGSKIDNGKISGKIYDDDPAGVMVYAYRHNENDIDPSEQKPDYVSQVGKNGKYILLGLSSGNYNIYAIRDKYRDFVYQMNDDHFGVQSRTLTLTDTLNEIIYVDFFLSIEDTIPPSITSVVMKDFNHFLVEFNEPIDSSKILASNFFLFDSTAKKRIDGKYFFKGEGRKYQYTLAISDSIIAGNQNYFYGENIFDKKGNKLTTSSFPITVKAERDTSSPKLLKASGLLPGDKVDNENPIIAIKFDDGFDHGLIKRNMSIVDQRETSYPFDIISQDDANFDVVIKTKLLPRTDYTLKFNLNNIADAVGNKRDSLYQYKFTTVNDLDFSGATGKVENVDDSKLAYVILKPVEKNLNSYKQKVDEKSGFNFARVLPGKYLLWGFKDSNSNGEYDLGTVKPLKYSEQFKFYPDTLNLRARWPVGDVILKFDKGN